MASRSGPLDRSHPCARGSTSSRPAATVSRCGSTRTASGAPARACSGQSRPKASSWRPRRESLKLPFPPSGAHATGMADTSVRPRDVRRNGHRGGWRGEASDQEFELNREIIEAIKQIEREKGIEAETLLVALEDA